MGSGDENASEEEGKELDALDAATRIKLRKLSLSENKIGSTITDDKDPQSGKKTMPSLSTSVLDKMRTGLASRFENKSKELAHLAHKVEELHDP